MIWSAQSKNGVHVHLHSLVVDTTYGGLLEGLPNARLNAKLLKHAIHVAQRQFSDWPVYLVDPHVEDNSDPRLPSFRCIGLFESFVTRAPDMHASALVVVWFQDESIVNGIDLSLTELDWLAHAKDFEY